MWSKIQADFYVMWKYIYFFYGSSDVSFGGSVTSRLKKNTSSPCSRDCAISCYD